MEHIFRLLDSIRDKYGVYIGELSLERRSHFLSGYACALLDLTGERVVFDAAFQRFVEARFGQNGKHWDGLLSEGREPKEAFSLFFVLLEEFKREIPDAFDTDGGID